MFALITWLNISNFSFLFTHTTFMSLCLSDCLLTEHFPFPFQVRDKRRATRRGSQTGLFVSSSKAKLQKYGIPMIQSATCQRCSRKFTTFLRRHHCRFCGHSVCSDCSKREKFHATTGELERICNGWCQEGASGHMFWLAWSSFCSRTLW